MIHRLLSIPMTKVNYNAELNTIKFIAMKNGYKKDMIDRMLKNINKDKQRTPDKKDEIEKRNYIGIPYNTTLNKAIRKTFTNSKYKIGFKTRTIHLI